MLTYTKPEMTFEPFDVEDIITASSGGVDPKFTLYDIYEALFMPLG